jgi:hypothetical protein
MLLRWGDRRRSGTRRVQSCGRASWRTGMEGRTWSMTAIRTRPCTSFTGIVGTLASLSLHETSRTGSTSGKTISTSISSTSWGTTASTSSNLHAPLRPPVCPAASFDSRFSPAVCLWRRLSAQCDSLLLQLTPHQTRCNIFRLPKRLTAVSMGWPTLCASLHRCHRSWLQRWKQPAWTGSTSGGAAQWRRGWIRACSVQSGLRLIQTGRPGGG